MGRTIAWIARGLLLLMGGVIACGGSPTEPGWTELVHVGGSVFDYRTNAVVSGARVAFSGATATADAGGHYLLAVLPGEYIVSIDDVALNHVWLKDRTYRGDFYVHTAGCIGRYGTVVDSRTRRAVSGATVSVGGGTATSDQNGWFRLGLGCAGDACIGFNTAILSISHPNYENGRFVAGRGVCGVSRVDYELVRR